MAGGHHLTPRQQQLYDLVKEKREVSIPEACRALDLKEGELRREFATLRHMELLRGCKKDELILITLF
jgi:DeoR/GlpR family transcriptional regulator of sugar metabolism